MQQTTSNKHSSERFRGTTAVNLIEPIINEKNRSDVLASTLDLLDTDDALQWCSWYPGHQFNCMGEPGLSFKDSVIRDFRNGNKYSYIIISILQGMRQRKVNKFFNPL